MTFDGKTLFFFNTYDFPNDNKENSFGNLPKYVRDTIGNNVIEHSNGESALQYFSEKIKDDGLYLLDEPENSLLPQRQLELLEFIQNSARFFGCQFIIATHSPFLLALKGARIYDLDESPVDIKKWTELEGVRTYFDFLKSIKMSFEKCAMAE